MKASLVTTATLFALTAILHIFVINDRAQREAPDVWYVIVPVVVVIMSAALGSWAIMLIRRIKQLPASPVAQADPSSAAD